MFLFPFQGRVPVRLQQHLRDPRRHGGAEADGPQPGAGAGPGQRREPGQGAVDGAQGARAVRHAARGEWTW